MNQNNFQFEKKALPAKFGTYGMAFAGIGLLLCILAFVFEPVRSTFDSLIVFTFLMGIGLCAMFLIGIEYLTGAVWSVPFRRIGEFLTPLIFISFTFAVPVLINMHSVFHWTHIDVVQADKILSQKSSFLNPTFFTVRIIAILPFITLYLHSFIKNTKISTFKCNEAYFS